MVSASSSCHYPFNFVINVWSKLAYETDGKLENICYTLFTEDLQPKGGNMFEALGNNIFSHNKIASPRCGEIYCHSPIEFTIHCELCEFKSTEYELFLLHYKLMHSDNIMLQNEETADESSSYVDVNLKADTVEHNSNNFCKMDTSPSVELESGCKVQNFRGVDEEYIPELQTKTLKKQRKCEYCSKTYRSTTHLQNHIALEHALNDAASSLTPVKCTECSEQFSNHHLLNNHSIKEHNGIQCPYCHRKFKCKANLIRHTEEIHTHSNNAKFVCDFDHCSKRFYTQQHLTDHKRATHGKPKNYVCDVCGYSCRARSTLRVHSQTHTDDRPFSCDVCNGKFKTKDQLVTHRDIHNRGNERNFVCDFENCTKTFFSGRRLAVHIRNHKMPKKYVCDICGYRSKHNQSLKIHHRKHMGEIPNKTC